MEELKRQARKREQVLYALKEKGSLGITNVELSDISLRYGAHLGKLYELGYEIRKESLGEGLFNYTLKSEPPKDFVSKKKAMEVLMEAVKEEEIIDAEKLEQMLDDLGIMVKYKANTHKQSA